MKYKTNKLIVMINILLIAVLVFIDQWTKKLAVSKLKGQESCILIKDVLHLQYLENRGAAFGILQNSQIFFIIVSVIFVLCGIYALFIIPTSSKYTAIRFTVMLIIAGAVGNCIDRVIQNFVVDFIYFIYIDFPVFNVADIYVTVGTALLIILILFFYKDDDLDFKRIKAKKENAS